MTHHYEICYRSDISEQGQQSNTRVLSKGISDPLANLKSSCSIKTLMRHPTQLAEVLTDFSSILTAFSGRPKFPGAQAL